MLRDARTRVEEAREMHKCYFEAFDRNLDSCSSGPRWLEWREIAEIVTEALRFRDGKKYTLLAFCIMPNHVHLLVERTVGPLYRTLQAIKSWTGRQANLALRRAGRFW